MNFADFAKPQHFLTFGRMGLVVPILILLRINTPGAKVFALILFIVASLTDCLDGYFARRRKEVTDFGKFVDPLADKVFVLCILVYLALVKIVPLWMVILIASREVLVTVFRSKGKKIFPGILAKTKTAFQMITISIILFLICLEGNFAREIFIYTLMLITMMLTLVSGLDYFWKHRNLNKKRRGEC